MVDITPNLNVADTCASTGMYNYPACLTWYYHIEMQGQSSVDISRSKSIMKSEYEIDIDYGVDTMSPESLSQIN